LFIGLHALRRFSRSLGPRPFISDIVLEASVGRRPKVTIRLWVKGSSRQ